MVILALPMLFLTSAFNTGVGATLTPPRHYRSGLEPQKSAYNYEDIF